MTLKNTKISADGLYIAAGSASKNDGTTLSIGSDGTNLLTGIGTGTYTDGAAGTGSWSAWSDSTSSSGTSGSASSSSGTSSGTSGSSEVSTSDTVSSTTGDVLTDATVQATKATESASKTDTSTSLFSDEEEAPVQVHDSGNSSTTPGAVAGRPGAVDDRTAPALSATVLSAIEQGNAQFESFVHQNIHDGYMAMEGILRASTSPEQRMAGASTLVNRIDSDKTLDEGAKLAQAYGMIQAVNDNATMSEDEKKALRKMIASNFRSLSSGVKTYLASVAASAAKRNA